MQDLRVLTLTTPSRNNFIGIKRDTSLQVGEEPKNDEKRASKRMAFDAFRSK